MWCIYALVTLTVMSPGAWSRSVAPTTRPPTYGPYSPDYGGFSPVGYPDYGPNIAPPFSVPGQIIDGITVTDILQAVGDLYRADNLQEGAGQACRRLGPPIGDLLSNRPGAGGLPTIDTICEFLEALDVQEECGELWDILVVAAGREDLIDGSQGIIPDLRCRQRDYDYSETPDYSSFWNFTYPDQPDYPFPSILERGLDTASPGDLNPYDPCSESGIEKVNNILFALMDWFGPSLFDHFYGYRAGDPYSICGLMRYILSMDIDEFIENLVGVLKFPMADILEAMQSFDICVLGGQPGAEVIEIVKDLLVAFSDLNEDQFCDFIAEEQTREAYLEEGETIVYNAFFLTHERCNNVLAIIAPFDEFGYFYKVTGFNVSTASERDEFCSVLIDAYSPSSSYVPTPYELPPGVDINNVTPFETPGEFLPGLTFVDLIELDGAGYNSEKVVDAIALSCTVFEDLLSSSIEVEQFDVRGFCTGVRHRALDIIEELCLAETVPDFFGADRPIGLRSFNPGSVFVYVAHEVSGIDDVSKEEICPAADDLLTERSFDDLLAQILDIFLTEALPSVHGLCQNWEETLCYWRPYCPVPEQPTESPEGVTEPPYYYYPYVPSPEYIEESNANFDRISSGLASIAWLIAGFEGREDTCAFVAEAIDPLSGRGDRASAEVARNQILGVFVDVDRCSRAVDTALGLIQDEDLQYILPEGSTNVVYQFTGYDTSREFCQAVAEAYSYGPTVTETPGGGGGQPVATINIVANIAVYIQRAARSIKSL